MKRVLNIINIILLGAIAFIAALYISQKSYQKNFTGKIFESEYARIAELSEGVNKMAHFPAGNQNLKGELVSTDALFSMMSFDITEKPLGIYLPLPASPWTITIYDENCKPFYSLDERRFGGDNLQVILYSGKQSAPQHEGVARVKSPGSKGIIVTRLILPGTNNDALLALRGEMKTGLINN